MGRCSTASEEVKKFRKICSRVSVDSIYGPYIEETITFSPSYEKLCGEYGLGSVCRPGDDDSALF